MAAIQPRTAEAFIKKPDAQFSVILVYGPDTGLVSERARTLITVSVDDPADPFQLVRLEGDDLADDPGRLVNEVLTIPLFGGQRAIWVKAGNRAFTVAVEPLLANPPRDCRVVIEGGDWKKSNTLVALVEKSRTGAVLACYGDERTSIGQLIADEVAAAGLSIAPEARETLIGLLGGDRLASRGEMQKLCLYAHGVGRIELGDVEAIVGDATNLVIDDLIDASFSGKVDILDFILARAWSESANPSILAGAALRHALFLHRLRSDVDKGQAAATVAEGAGREIHFKRKASVTAQLSALSTERLSIIVADLASAILEARRNGDLAPALVSRVLMRIALLTRARTKNG